MQDSLVLVKEQRDPHNRIESPEIDPHKFTQPVFMTNEPR